ncbi:hypothetical protein [Roseisolibacter sp. H3M3-2]|uniref:hypothetical protein n=1 Tax=Roseisolibacter sp. H3M3-2 TaxID=3031323 RepID=UPI0023DCCBA3|nr:hypothetical protein [Roseisolibacter sp. H3M3-2]MDF1504935.1 hypothetical protein [Roseisolibacter sp. H3M3-2]
MTRPSLARAALVVLPAVLLAAPARGQSPAAPATPPAAATSGWNDSTSLALVRRTAERRRAQLADTALRDYRATARGTLTFLGQLGDVFATPPRVIQATQVATEVYWRAPNLSKQRVIGTRDTTVLPTDNSFYRDRFGIVQNNFPNVIRVGDGRDVADVPHPLGPDGEARYEFAVRDSLAIRLGDRTVRVLEVQVRPRDPARPGIVGSLFVDRAEAQVVRMAFTFTSASYLDKRNEDVSIVLENALVQGRFWLPRRQEVEVRRAGTYMDFPARGIIRGRWDIGDYRVNTELPPATFAGPELEFASPAQRRAYAFEGSVLDAIPPDVTMVTDEDVARVQAQARALVQAQVLQRARGSALSARAVSDFVRANRVEGVALGAGYLLRLGGGVALRARARYGFADEAVKGGLALERRWGSGAALRLEGYRAYREAGDEPEVSLARNSLASQEFGSDWTDPFDVAGLALGAELAPWRGIRPSIAVAYETQDALSVEARPVTGRFEPTLPALTLSGPRVVLAAERAMGAGPFGTALQWRAEARGGTWSLGRHQGIGCDDGAVCGGFARAAAGVEVQRPLSSDGTRRLVLRTTLAGVAGSSTDGGGVPAQELVLLGGPVTGPGYDFHQFAGRFGASQRVEWRVPVPFPPISLGRYGRSPARATLAPYAHTVYVARPSDVRPGRGGWSPALGAGAHVFFDLLRFDVARGLRDGRWTFSVDVTRDFWRVL